MTDHAREAADKIINAIVAKNPGKVYFPDESIEQTIQAAIDQALADQPKWFPIQEGVRYKGAAHPTQIPWHVADLAYGAYSNRYGREQSLEELARRGGFCPDEMDMFLPDWRERCEDTRVKEALAAQKQQYLEACWKTGDEFRKALDDTSLSHDARMLLNGKARGVDAAAECIEAIKGAGSE